nr:hypothetical protein [Roseibium aggregatum]
MRRALFQARCIAPVAHFVTETVRAKWLTELGRQECFLAFWGVPERGHEGSRDRQDEQLILAAFLRDQFECVTIEVAWTELNKIRPANAQIIKQFKRQASCSAKRIMFSESGNFDCGPGMKTVGAADLRDPFSRISGHWKPGHKIKVAQRPIEKGFQIFHELVSRRRRFATFHLAGFDIRLPEHLERQMTNSCAIAP